MKAPIPLLPGNMGKSGAKALVAVHIWAQTGGTLPFGNWWWRLEAGKIPS